MFHACGQRFDVMGNLENFCKATWKWHWMVSRARAFGGEEWHWMLHGNTLRTNPRHGTCLRRVGSSSSSPGWSAEHVHLVERRRLQFLETRPLQCCDSPHFIFIYFFAQETTGTPVENSKTASRRKAK